MSAKHGPCRTPGTVYETRLFNKKIVLNMLLPRPIIKKLSDDEKARLISDLHDAVLPIMERLYSRTWDQFAGKKLTDHDHPMPDSHEDL